MDQEAFASACAWAAARLGQGGIGTLGEKSLHAALKYYFEPCPENHEQPLGGFVADAVGENGVIEIQSRSLFKLIPKLDAFLEACPVTVVHPLIGKKWVAWYTPEGVPVSRTRAPGKLRLTDAVPELYALKYMLDNPRFHFCICVVEAEEQRLLDGVGKDRKRRSTRLDRIPLALMQEVHFDCPADYMQLFPADVPEVFGSREIAQVGHMSRDTARILLNLLCYLELIQPAEQRGNAKYYRRVEG